MSVRMCECDLLIHTYTHSRIHSHITSSSIVSHTLGPSQDDSAEYRLFYRARLQKRPVIVRRLRIESVYHWGHHKMRAHIHSHIHKF